MDIVETSNNYGISQELLALSILTKYGTVSIPYGNSARYDCILELNNSFIKIQVKSLNILEDNDTIVIPMKNANIAKKIAKIYTEEEVDYIAIVYNSNIYLFQPNRSSTFRVRIKKPLLTNQHWLEDYHIEKVLGLKLITWENQKAEIRNSKEKPQFFCEICGSPVSEKGNLCIPCYKRKRAEESKRPPKEELIKSIKLKIPFVQIGKNYNTSDNAVRKWCQYYNLPYKKEELKNMTEEDWDKL